MMESCPSTGPNWSMLELYGDQQWWAGLGEAGADNVVFLLGRRSLWIFCIGDRMSLVTDTLQ